MPILKKRNGRLSKEEVAKREKWVLEQCKKHPEWTKEDLNAALVAKADLGGFPMRPVRVYEIKRAAKRGDEVVPPVVAGKRPSRRQVASHSAATDDGGGPPQRASRPGTAGGELHIVQRATASARKILEAGGLEDVEVQIRYRPPVRTVVSGG